MDVYRHSGIHMHIEKQALDVEKHVMIQRRTITGTHRDTHNQNRGRKYT